MDTIDYCGFIGRDPSRKRTFIATGDSGQGMTHGALAGILLKNLIVYGAGAWSDVYEPSRKPVSAVMNFINENVTAIKNFAEYLMPSEIESAEALKPGQGGILRDGTSKVAVCRTMDGKLHTTLRGVHASWLSHSLELNRAMLGLPMSWISVCSQWRRPFRARHCAAR